ncbi:MAG: HNH endonuclease [Verrucomicrobia bacterium]|nr:HNH endonuclease [Verrucomicrobiota bacterium]
MKLKLPTDFLKLCTGVTAKRPRTVIQHILKHGHITTQDLKDKYGYNHPPRAVRDVKEHGIPIEMFRVVGSDGRKIAAYKFGDPTKARAGRQAGRTILSSELKRALIERQGARCSIYCEVFPERELQIDHRVPFEVAGDAPKVKPNPDLYMLLCGSANRAKSWSCEHCANWRELKKLEICRNCYWAYPDSYTHVAMRPVRRADILWGEAEVQDYERLKRQTKKLQKNIPGYVKEIVNAHLRGGTT